MKRRVVDEPLNKMLYLRATALEQEHLKAAAQERGVTVTRLIWEAIYKFLGWK